MVEVTPDSTETRLPRLEGADLVEAHARDDHYRELPLEREIGHVTDAETHSLLNVLGLAPQLFLGAGDHGRRHVEADDTVPRPRQLDGDSTRTAREVEDRPPHVATERSPHSEVEWVLVLPVV